VFQIKFIREVETEETILGRQWSGAPN
jgi:hypothetical protein